MEALQRKILYNKQVSRDYFRMGLEWKTPDILPGQFIMARVSDGLDPLLRRPFGIYNVLGAKGRKSFRGKGVEIVYRVVGRGTKILSNREAGETIDILGPLGNGFPGPPRPEAGKVLLVAGGMGIAPLYLLAKSIKDLKRVELLFGTRGRAESVLAGEFRDLGCRVKISSEDGSIGRKGLVTELLEEEIVQGSTVYACGPVGMLKAVSAMAARLPARCYVSLERGMACGIGVCLGCAVKAKGHDEKENRNYRMVCSEGPVFDSADIDWSAL